VPPLLSEDSQLTLDEMAVLLSCLSTGGEILQLLQNLDVSKSNGPDGISAKMLKGTSCSIASSLTKLFNISIQSGSVPCGWKSSMVVPILKDGEKSMPTNYRPISLLPIVSNILECHIQCKIMLHLQGTYPISDKQWGFCAKESTVHALLSAMDDWLESLETGADIGAVFSTSLRPLT